MLIRDKADNVPGKSSFARLKKRVRSLRALAKSKLMVRRRLPCTIPKLIP